MLKNEISLDYFRNRAEQLGLSKRIGSKPKILKIEQIRKLAIAHSIPEIQNNQTLSIEQFGPSWMQLCQKNHSGQPICYDNHTDQTMRLAPNLEKKFKAKDNKLKPQYNINTPLDFDLQDLTYWLSHPGEYLQFLEDNYVLGKVASTVSKTLDTPRLPFFGLYSWSVENLGMIGQNPLLAGKLGKFAAGQNFESQGRAGVKMSLADKAVHNLYEKTLFERRATKVEIRGNRVVGIEYDNYLKGTVLSMDNLIAKGAI
jgi:hypothetical protein